MATAEVERLRQNREGQAAWKRWGPYLSERAWGTVREDYSADGSAWEYFPHDHARSKAYRWNEDGLAGICDDRQYLCFALALWNGNDPILKERLFGLTGNEGNHGEDVKEYYFYLDNTPTHSYMEMLYKYPQGAFPYAELVEESRRRSKSDPEQELFDTGIFEEDRYFDIVVEYAKADPQDILIRISATNCGPEPAVLHLLPTLWYRNRWAWGWEKRPPDMTRVSTDEVLPVPRTNGSPPWGGPWPGNPRVAAAIRADHPVIGTYWLLCHADENAPELLFTENETNYARLYPPDGVNPTPYVKDGINDYIVHGKKEAVNPAQVGTKVAAHYRLDIPGGQTRAVRLRLSHLGPQTDPFGASFDGILQRRKREADAFYATVIPEGLSEDACLVMRQALAGMLWNKQFYHYNVEKWLQGDPAQPPPPPSRWKGRNHDWTHIDNEEILSVPDKWEFPWYAAWDLAFHCVCLALVDSEFAKSQLILLLREWYMHPNGQLPAYEWAFGDANPPVHAWAAHRVYQIERRRRGVADTLFLERVFHKLLINFTWWVNRKDIDDRNIFQGGFLGMDNIGPFDRNVSLPGCRLDQSDGTSWMAMYCLNMLAIALELARRDKAYEDVATKFLEHFFHIARAMNDRPGARGGDFAQDLWDNEDEFYYDMLNFDDGQRLYLRVRSMVGIIPLFAVQTLDADLLELLPDFRRNLDWYLQHRPDLCGNVASIVRVGNADRRLFSVVNEARLRSILRRVLDESEFLSPYGIRSVSRYHREHPFVLELNGTHYQVDYEPAESSTGLFGGNSNWRGPIWFPLNYLLIESLQKFDYYFGDSFQIECPTGSGQMMTLWEVATELSRRLIRLFLRDENGRRPVFGGTEKFQSDPRWRDLIPFHEYFHGDNGAGLGASHQTGWTGLVAKLIQQSGK